MLLVFEVELQKRLCSGSKINVYIGVAAPVQPKGETKDIDKFCTTRSHIKLV